MKSNKIQTILLVGLVFFSFSFSSLKAIDYPLEIDVIYIRFNHNSNSNSDDATSIKKCHDCDVIELEWYPWGQINEPCAYIKNQTNRKIKVLFQHNQNQSQSYYFVIGAAVAEGTSFGYVPYKSVYFPSNNNGFSNITTYQVTGTVPGSVGKRYVKFAWWCVNYALSMGYTGKHYYYTLLANPQEPMPVPWIPVLDYACVWASGMSAETSALTDITEGAYDNFPVNYYGWDSHSPYTTCNLTDLLVDGWADCRDMSAIVQIFVNAIGGSNTQVRRINGQFYTQLIDPIGSPGWGTTLWNFHQVAWKSDVWDACLRLDYSNPRIPVNEDINGEYKDDLFDTGYWTPQTPSSYTAVE